MASHEPLPIAVIGVGCRLPGRIKNTEEFWSMLSAGRDAWSEVPEDRFCWESFHHQSHEAQGCTNSRGGHFIDQDISTIDAEFFGIPPLEAKSLDPQQRLMLETTHECIENAGLSSEKLRGSDTAVYTATFSNDYERMLSKDMNDITPYHLLGTGNATFANRISHAFDLTGPSVALDTGCSGSLVAIHQACQTLRCFESDLAIAGGAVLILCPDHMVAMSPQHILNNDGRCYSFDDRGSGYGRGEGAGVVLLKRLDQALRDGDPVRAIIRSTACNQDGRTNGIALPDRPAQERLAKKAFRNLPFSPQDVQFVEAHATGTIAGDEAEVSAIHNIYCNGRHADQALIIGSVKPNIGHLEAASGVIGLIKAMVSLEKGSIPPNVLFDNPKERLPLDDRIKIATEMTPWPATSGPRRAVVNSFGYGGTNAIAVLEAFDSALDCKTNLKIPELRGKRPATSNDSGWVMLPFSAKSRISLSGYISDLKTWAEKQGLSLCIASIARMLSTRNSLPWRHAIVVNSISSLFHQLTITPQTLQKAKKSNIVFVFTGQGAQWPKMGGDLMCYPRFAQSIQRSDAILRKIGCQWSLEEEMLSDATVSEIHNSEIAQPATTALQIALIDLLASWDISPLAVVGHSSGEIAAAYAVRALSNEGALTVAFHRGSLAKLAKERTKSSGAMLAVGLGNTELQTWIDSMGLEEHITVACINSPSSTTASGTVHAILTLQNALTAQGIFARRLKVSTAYHSRHMEIIAQVYRSLISHVPCFSSAADIAFYSTVTTEKKLTDFNCAYWVSNLVSPVHFSTTLGSLAFGLQHAEHMKIVEIGPHAALLGPIRETMGQLCQQKLSSWSYQSVLLRGESGIRSVLQSAASLFESGCDVQLNSESPRSDLSRNLPGFPNYHWDRKHFWHEPRLSYDYRHRLAAPHDLLGLRILTSPQIEPNWRVLLSTSRLPWLEDHIIDGFVVFPAAAYIAMAIEALNQWIPYRGDGHYNFRHVAFRRALYIPKSPELTELVLNFRTISHEGTEFAAFSITEGQWHEHCRGQLEWVAEPNASGERSDRDEIDCVDDVTAGLEKGGRICTDNVQRDQLYAVLRVRGNDYGPTFSSIQDARVCDSAALVTVKVPDFSASGRSMYDSAYTIHPALFDAFLQIPVYLFSRRQSVRSIVPVSFKNVTVNPRIRMSQDQGFIVYCELYDILTTSSTFDVTAYQEGEDGTLRPVARCYGGELRATGHIDDVPKEKIEGSIFEMTWELDPASITSADLESKEAGVLFDVKLQEEKLRSILNAANFYITSALADIQRLNLVPVKGHLACAYQSLTRSNTAVPLENVLRDRDQVSSLGIEGELIDRIGPALKSILAGEVDPLNVLLEDDLLYRAYQDDSTKRCSGYLIQYLRRLVFKNPMMRILEIGAGTGGSTKPVFEALSPSGEAFCATYHFTDISTGFFDQARVSLAQWDTQIIMKSLNIEQDPVSQGFEQNSYDLIIASNVLHATRKISETLRNIHQLLKPGACLAMTELIHTNSFYRMTFGMLPGWWSGTSDGRVDGPLLSIERWTHELRQASFADPNIIAFDFPGPAQRAALIISQAKLVTAPNGYHIYHANLLSSLDREDLRNSIMDPLSGQLLNRDYSLTHASWDSEIEPTSSYVILDSSIRPLLATCTSEQFQHITSLIQNVSTIIWIILHEEDSALYNPEGALVIGFARTACSEFEGLRFVTVEIQSTEADDKIQVSALVADILSATTNDLSIVNPLERHFKIDNGRIYIPRMIKSAELDSIGATENVQRDYTLIPYHSPSHTLHLDVDMLVSEAPALFTEDSAQTKPGQNGVEIEVHAWAVDPSLGAITPSWSKLGHSGIGQCAGIVTSTDDGVDSGFSIGDRVYALSTTSYASKVRVHEQLLHHVSDSMDFNTAVGSVLPLLFAYYSIVEVGRLQSGQRVLISLGHGSVGQAIAHVAVGLGADVYCVASDAHTQQLLVGTLGVPDNHIFSKGSFATKRKIMRMTAGLGVDLAVDFSDEPSPTIIDCVAELGIFVSHHKQGNWPVNLGPLKKSITVSFVDASVLFHRKPGSIRKALRATFKMLNDGILLPLHFKIMSIADTQQALKAAQENKQMQFVLDASPEVKVLVRNRPSFLSQEATYVICGGLGKLGRQICKHLAYLGASCIVLVTRQRFESQGRRDLERHLSTQKSTVNVITCDISRTEDVETLTAYMEKRFPPVKGIIQGAMILRDKSINKMKKEDFEAALGPKYHGTRNIIQALQHVELDFFIVLSSLSGIVGLPGQANYAAGNTYQDQIIHYDGPRLWKRLIALDLPLLADTNVLSRLEEPKLVRRGMKVLSNEALFPFLEYAMGIHSLSHLQGKGPALPSSPKDAGHEHETVTSQQIVVGLDMQSASEDNRGAYLKNPLFSHVAALQRPIQNIITSSREVRSAIEQVVFEDLPTDEACGFTIKALREKISSLVAASLDDIDVTTRIVSFGLDSLIAIELKNWITKAFGAPILTSDILDARSITTLAQLILKRVKTTRSTTQEQGIVVDGSQSQAVASVNLSKSVQQLPQQPLQSLDTILNTFYDSIEALSTADELAATRQAIDELKLPNNVGSKLYARLEKLAHNPSIHNWIADIYNKNIWFRRRASLRPAINFFSTHVLSERDCTQAEKAALLSLTALQFKQNLDTDQVSRDSIAQEPQCMASLGWIFNTYRRPGKVTDTPLRSPGNDYIAVMKNGHVFKVPLVRQGKPVSFTQLVATFEMIRRNAPHYICWLSLLTTDERDQWATHRALLVESNTSNGETISMIEKCLFVVCLDDALPETSEERVRAFLLDDNKNRWNDKTLSFIVCENGVSAFWCEHSMIDGTTMDKLGEAITRAITEGPPAVTTDTTAVSEGFDFIALPFVLSSEIEARITIVRQSYRESTQNTDFATVDLPILSDSYLRQRSLAPKGVLQAIVSLALRKHYGYSPPAYEPVSLRSFRLGRLDIYQVYTSEMAAFITSAISMTSTKDDFTAYPEAYNLLQSAIHAHSTGIANTSRGRGWGRQLSALRFVLQDGEEEPALFSDPLYIRSRPRKVFVTFSDRRTLEWGSLREDRDALWIGIVITETRCNLSVSNREGRVKEFCEWVRDAADVVQKVIERGSA